MKAAIPLLEEAYSGHRDVLGQTDPRTLRAAMNLANALADEPGRKAQSHEMLGTAVEGYITSSFFFSAMLLTIPSAGKISSQRSMLSLLSAFSE